MHGIGHGPESVDQLVVVDTQLPGGGLTNGRYIGVTGNDQPDSAAGQSDHGVDQPSGDPALFRGHAFPGGRTDESIGKGQAIDGSGCKQRGGEHWRSLFVKSYGQGFLILADTVGFDWLFSGPAHRLAIVGERGFGNTAAPDHAAAGGGIDAAAHVGAAIGHGMVPAVVTVENKQPGDHSLAFQTHPAARGFQLVHSGKIDAHDSVLHAPGVGIGGQRRLTDTK